MTILLSVSVLAFMAALFLLAHVMRIHGLDGLLYLASAQLHAYADAVRAGKREYGQVRPAYIAQALASRAITEPEASA